VTDLSEISVHDQSARAPNCDLRTVCGNRQLAAVEPAADFRAPSRQAAGHRGNNHAMSGENPKIHAIYRYPVKGLSPEPLQRTKLAVGETLPGGRPSAISNR